MTEKIIILDFGSQYTQLIARAVREANVYCEILPFSKSFAVDESVKGVILSGSPFSVNDEAAPEVDVALLAGQLPVLGICYGAQLAAKQAGGKVERSNKREYGRAILRQQKDDALLQNTIPASQVWMSHGDSILELPQGFEILATTDSIPIAAFKATGNKQLAIGNQQPADANETSSQNTNTGNRQPATGNPLYGLQFHPEVYHSIEGKKILRNFLVNICV